MVKNLIEQNDVSFFIEHWLGKNKIIYLMNFVLLRILLSSNLVLIIAPWTTLAEEVAHLEENAG